MLFEQLFEFPAVVLSAVAELPGTVLRPPDSGREGGKDEPGLEERSGGAPAAAADGPSRCSLGSGLEERMSF